MQPASGCTCIESGAGKKCHNHNATCSNWGNSGDDWCYVSDDQSCKTKVMGKCGVPWTKCESSGE